MHPPSVQRCCTRAGALGREVRYCISVNRLLGATSLWCQQSSECGVSGWTRYDEDKYRHIIVRGKKTWNPILTALSSQKSQNNISNKKAEGWSRTITVRKPTKRTTTINVAWKGNEMNWWTKGLRGLTLVLDYFHIIKEVPCCAASNDANDQADCTASIIAACIFLENCSSKWRPCVDCLGLSQH